jgi:hypothetical protein
LPELLLQFDLAIRVRGLAHLSLPLIEQRKSPLPGGGGSGLRFRIRHGRRCTVFIVGVWEEEDIRHPNKYELPNDSAIAKRA